ncbi:ABC transporter substrate-binding protein [Hydrogenibacillus schlegelii]|uniref:ABC transporter substrate-binding protein n=1 Tax=Hydrogenibacillus schlegelii TaxID=1484 RepID=A0A132N7H0_HYDSH|nr:ABC transporter substrate-binding protein [Hydrogenibacillus schlegelii]KWX06053.1 spermidine/putrescine ABC transporter substrate-binding protein [Hydrogenibacillus schlegelii]MBT9282529.1 ABC transporter substrate-binding protein [Hydrogenibacillus schlegelii]OAR04324.1 spermidine/putrescine ABC transporter substrate-binding protein [Hydrogenibacillus schlegelii]PTQ52281.1 MAG: ABC transporter, periplasmic spermidine putrescine-binding protein PotD [Hydrogenibacillus schlegelii]
MRAIAGLYGFVAAAALLLWGVLAGLEHAAGGPADRTLIVFNWGDYLDPSLLQAFEAETGIRVVLETFDSNEAMLAKIRQGGTPYDVAVPSEYALSRMIAEGLVRPLDPALLPNLKNLDPRFLNLPFDPGNRYSVPYFWGTVGIAYNREALGEGAIRSWNDLWDPRFRDSILLIDGVREVIGLGLQSLGYSLNDTDPVHLAEAKARLDALKPNVRAIVGDEIKFLLAGEEAPIGVVWSGDAAEVIDENDAFDYVIPEEGSNLWFDSLVIPTTARNVAGAHAFINFLLDAEVAAQNTEYILYSTPNRAAMALLPPEIRDDRRFYPDDATLRRLEVYRDLGRRTLAAYSELYMAFKMHRK